MASIDKKRLFKTIRNILVSAIILVILLVGAGVGYVWYNGQQDNSSAIAKEAEPVAPVVNTKKVKKQSSPNAKASVSLQSITSPVAPGSNAGISVRTNQDAKCKITVVYNKVASKDSGLVEKEADEYGTVDWTWTVESSVPVGKWPVTITCSLDEKRSAVLTSDLVVSRDANQN